MTAPAKASATGYVEAARALAPRVAELANDIESQRRLVPELVEAFRAAGFFGFPVPESVGGLQVDPVTAAKVVEEISAGDGSASWCVMIGLQNAAFSGFFSPERAREVFGDGQIVCGTARPTGRAVKQGSDFVLTGRWPFASGSSHADWFAAECMLFDGDEPLRDAEGNHMSRMLMVPRSEVTIHDTWHTTGLRGTASNDFEVKGATVPADRGFQMLVTQSQYDWPLYTVPGCVFVTHGAQALGVAKGAIKSATRIAETKIGYGSDKPTRYSPKFQGAIAEAVVTVAAAGEYMYQQCEALWQKALAGEADSDPKLRARVRLATSNAVRASVHAVDLLHATLGTSSLFETTPLERQFRDIHMAAAHVMISQFTYEAAGRVELGLEAEFPFF
ncbi:MAG: acyl-CoA dehydrogenase family protein [Dehalococcoidia bacterium]